MTICFKSEFSSAESKRKKDKVHHLLTSFVVGGKCVDGGRQKYKKASEENHLVHYKLMVRGLKPDGRALELAWG